MPQGSPPPFAQNRSNMAIFKVEGGRRLRGEITPQGAKNEALQILCATLLTQEKVIVHNVPQILDVIQLIELLQAMGVEVERLSEESYSFRAADIDPDYLRSDDYCRRASRLRGSVMLLGPMLARFGVGYMPKPAATRSAAAGSTPTSSAFRSWAPRSISTLRPPAPKSAARNSRDATCCSTRLR